MNQPKISIIVAIDDKNGIGKDNGLLWQIPEEIKHFKEITTGHPIIMGRKTHESIGKALPNRTNIVITRDKNYQTEGCIVTHSLDEAIEKGSSIEAEDDNINKEIFIIGGGEIYRQAMEQGVVDKIYLTHVQGDFKATVFFPDYSKFNKVVFKSEAFESNGFQYRYLVLEIA